MNGTDGWPSEWLRATLALCVLGVLQDDSGHGYLVAARLAEAGLGEVKGGTLYPILARLEDSGWVASAWEPGVGGPGRKVFHLTDAGRARLHEQRAEGTDFVDVTQAVLGAAEHRGPRRGGS